MRIKIYAGCDIKLSAAPIPNRYKKASNIRFRAISAPIGAFRRVAPAVEASSTAPQLRQISAETATKAPKTVEHGSYQAPKAVLARHMLYKSGDPVWPSRAARHLLFETGNGMTVRPTLSFQQFDPAMPVSNVPLRGLFLCAELPAVAASPDSSRSRKNGPDSLVGRFKNDRGGVSRRRVPLAQTLHSKPL